MNQSLPSLKWSAVLLLGAFLLAHHSAFAASKAEPIPPVIDEQPISRIATAGGHVVLSVAAHGTSSLQYQWFTSNHTVPVADSAASAAPRTLVVGRELGQRHEFLR